MDDKIEIHGKTIWNRIIEHFPPSDRETFLKELIAEMASEMEDLIASLGIKARLFLMMDGLNWEVRYEHDAKYYRIEMLDGSQWEVPVAVIALDRAKYYAKDFGGDVKKSLKEDTLPLFEANANEIKDWAANNMDWDDVKDYAVEVYPPTPLPRLTEDDFQEGWTNGKSELVQE